MTLPNVRILIANDADTASLTASPVLVATLPVANLQETSRGKVARTTSTANQDILGSWAASTCLSCMTLWRHNLTSSATVRLQLYSGINQTGSVLYDSGAVAAHPVKALGDLDLVYDPLTTSVFTSWNWAFTTLWFPALWCQSFRITLVDAANPAGYFQAARLILGRHFEPLYNMSYGVEMAWAENTKLTRTDGGSLRSEATESFRQIKFSLDHLDDGDRAHLAEVTRQLGMRKDFFVSCYPGALGAKERDHAMVAKFSTIPSVTYPIFNYFAANFSVEET